MQRKNVSFIAREYRYDKYGNMVKSADPLGNITTYNYGYVPLYSSLYYEGVYLCGIFNQQYGLTKGYSHDPLTGRIISTYNYTADITEASSGTSLNTLSSAYTGDDNEINYAPATGWDVLPPPPGCMAMYTRYSYDGLGRINKIWQPGDRYCPKLPDIDEPSNVYEYYDRGDAAGHPYIIERQKRGNGQDNEYTKIAYIYDSRGNLIQTQRLIDPNDTRAVITSYKYDSHNLNTRQTRPYNGQLARLGTYAAPAWSSLASDSFVYDGLQRPVKTIYPDGNFVSKQYDGNYEINTDANGQITTFQYDPFGNLASVVDAQGSATAYESDCLGRLKTITPPAGNPSSYFYNGLGQLTEMQTPDMGGKKFVYDDAGNLRFMQDANRMGDPNGNWVYYRYDKTGRMTSSGLYKYTGTGDPIFVPSDTGSIEYLQPTTINIYDEYYGYRDTTIGAANASWFSEPSQPDSFIISGNGVSNIIGINATYVRSKNIYATDGTPGSTGITEETEPVDYDTVCFWGKPELFIGKAETDIFSDRWRTYIEPIDLSQFYKSDEDTILGIYLCLHNRNINPSANVVLYRLPYYYYKYYADGYLYCYENPWKIKSTTWLVQPSYGGTDSDVNYENVAEDTLNKYDSMRTVWQTSGCVDSVNISDWAKSWLNGSLLQNGIMISEESDINFYYATVSTYPPYLNIITSDTVPCNITLKPTYPGADYFTVYWTTSELAKCEVQYSTDESYSNVIVSQDEYFNHSITISGLNQNTVYNYRIKAVDKSGNLTFTRGLQFKTGDLPGIAYYMFSRGRPTVSMSEGDTAVFSYDERGRLLAKKTKRSGRSYLERRQYDKQNNLIAFETTSNGTTNYFYNAMGQLSSIVCGDNQLASYTYTAAGACSTEAFGNGVSSIYSYHPRQWLKAAAMTGNSGTMFNHAYQYDANGNLTFDEDNTGLSSSTDRYYAYDPLNRLTYEGSQPGPNAIDVTLPGVVNYGLSYRYDARGNRTSGAGASYSYYPGTNRLQAVTNPDGSQTPYDYDGNGNTVYDGRWQYEYDFQNRQSRVHSEASTSINNINYTYNAAGLRTGSVNSLTQFGGQVASLAATFPEPYEDLVESAPSGDGHDDARDMGTLKVHVNDNFLFFEITHKYLYGTSQGNYENIYIALDTDQKFGSGASWLPDDIKVRVTADNAWERCIVIYDEQNFGICTAEGFRLEKLETDDGKKMKVNYTNGRNSKAIIKVPVALLGNPEKVRFVIVSTMPGAASYKISTACDVLPGGKKSIDSQLLTAYNEYTMPLAPGAVRSTTTTEGYLYDNDGNLMADLDGEKNITKRYVYGLGGKHLAMQINNTGYGPYSNACDDTANISIGGDSSPLTFNFTTDKQQGAFALQVNVGNPSGVGCNAGNFGLYNQGIEVESANYGYVHIWVKPLTAGSWMTFHVWDVKYGDWKTLKGDKDGDMYYEADQDMAVGQWNELWLKLDNNDKEWTQTKVRSFSMHASNNASFIIDGVYTCSRDWKTFYYSCDYLNSPRVMTDATGAVVWRQDYLAFGSEAGTVATGNTHKFTGHIKDDATGQYYAKARYFTTGLGRWSQPEPLLKGVPSKGFLMNSQMLNPYVYCHNNPIKYSDPDGHLPWNEIAAGKNDIRSSFGPRTDPVTKAPARHEGMDVRMQTGTNLRSAAAGTIINVENKTTGYGTNITIQHENGFTTRYGHMNSTSVSVGQQVNEGQTIGTSGSTGKSTGPHLHFEVRQNGAAIDPTTVNLGAYNSYPSDPQAQQTIENLKPWGVEFNKDPAKSKPIPEVQ
ncbi:peptidoglycan DD-metalloendopeptidase family protein [candidate division TA06 bacterium]|nr:peptidoglycan DD-metalloendopeptidase family protein [candidate division TA06 bacterium]